MGKSGKSTKHRKTRDFLAGPGGRRQGARPLSPTERRETPSAMPRPGGPWPDLRAAAPLPPTPGLLILGRRAGGRGSRWPQMATVVQAAKSAGKGDAEGLRGRLVPTVAF